MGYEYDEFINKYWHGWKL